MDDERIYETSFIQGLFDEMAGTYGFVNLVASFGFAARWRKQCLRQVALEPGMVVLDLMTGMGELLPDVVRRIGSQGRVTGVDISRVMCERARGCARRWPQTVEIVEGDALANDLPDGCADVVVSSFGLKTLSPRQWAGLAAEVARLLRPGGTFSLVEISVPQAGWLRGLYLFYLKRLIPTVGRVCLGNPENYRMLGVYTERFGGCSVVQPAFEGAGLNVREVSYFYGCATGLVGTKRAAC